MDIDEMRPTEIRRFYDSLSPGRFPCLVDPREPSVKIFPVPLAPFIPEDLYVAAPHPLRYVIDTSLRPQIGETHGWYRYIPAPIEYFSIAHYLYIANEFGCDILDGFCEKPSRSSDSLAFKREQIRDLVEAGIKSYPSLKRNHNEYHQRPLENPIKDILCRIPEGMLEPTSKFWWTLWWTPVPRYINIGASTGTYKYYVLQNRKTGEYIHYTGPIRNKPSGWSRVSGPHEAHIPLLEK